MAIVFIGLGSNLDNPKLQVETALQELNSLTTTSLLKHSQLYSSKPLAQIQMANFVNAVAQIQTQLSPHQLLTELKQLEKAHNRQKTFHWGPRSLDLDILLYDELILATPDLTIPHSQMHKRDFVLVPLASLEPDLEIPNFGKISNLLVNLESNDLQILQD